MDILSQEDLLRVFTVPRPPPTQVSSKWLLSRQSIFEWMPDVLLLALRLCVISELGALQLLAAIFQATDPDKKGVAGWERRTEDWRWGVGWGGCNLQKMIRPRLTPRCPSSPPSSSHLLERERNLKGHAATENTLRKSNQ